MSRPDYAGQTLCPQFCLRLLLGSVCLQQAQFKAGHSYFRLARLQLSILQSQPLQPISFLGRELERNRRHFVFFFGIFQGFRLLRDNFSPYCNPQQYSLDFKALNAEQELHLDHREGRGVCAWLQLWMWHLAGHLSSVHKLLITHEITESGKRHWH